MRDWFSEREVATFISITWFLLSFYTDVINGCSFYHPCLTFTALTLKRDTVICQLVPLNQRGPTFTKETVATVHLVYCFKQRSRREVVFTFLTGLRQPLLQSWILYPLPPSRPWRVLLPKTFNRVTSTLKTRIFFILKAIHSDLRCVLHSRFLTEAVALRIVSTEKLK